MSGSDPSHPTDRGSATETLRVAVVPCLGGRLGRYDLVQVVGHGAMATVFRALDSQLGREVAVKVMSLAVAARAESAERFRREAQAVAAVKHPGIVEIFDFVGATSTEPAYIVSELIEGPTLRQFLDARRGRVLPEAAALIAIPIAEALGVAHSRGIIHRDIKPDNVMLDRGGGKCRVVVTDFGVAHITGLETMTATGALVGSPAFMSPEQARGHEVGPASDLWALGVLIYEMATGHLPFPGKDPLLVVASIARGVYKKPSAVSPYVGSCLDEICGRCLRLEPKERYPDLAGLVEDLRAFCRAGGLETTERNLHKLISDPDGFDERLRPQVADAAVAQARRHSRRGELGRALGELARATAYVPKHPEAERLVASISWRRQWLKVAGMAAGALALAGAVVFLAPRVRRLVAPPPAVEQQVLALPQTPAQEAPPPLTGATEMEKTGASSPPAGRQRAEVSPTQAGPGPRRSSYRSDMKPSKGPRHPTMDSGKQSSPAAHASKPGRNKKPSSSLVARAASAVPSAAGEQRLPGLAATIPTPAPPAEPVVTIVDSAPPRPRRVAVEMFASHFYCSPSLDNEKPAIAPRYTVMEGSHVVFCTMSGGGRKLRVKTIQITAPPEGQKIRIQLRRGEQDEPVIDWDNTTGVRQVDPDNGEKAPGGTGRPR
jgi:tRNA A-37 threonylcarbamoyl transferase component Bud32